MRMSVKESCGHLMETILTLLVSMTEAESARLDSSYYLTRALGKSISGREDMVLMLTLVSVSWPT